MLDANAKSIGQLAAKLGGKAMPLTCDVAQESEVNEAFRSFAAAHGKLDVLYNCAGVESPGDSRIHETELDVWNRTLAINLTGVFQCCRAAIRLMLNQPSGGSAFATGADFVVDGGLIIR